MAPRLLVAGFFALLMSGLSVRTAFVKAFAEDHPETAAKVWNDHPDVLKSGALASIAAAAARGDNPPPSIASLVSALAERAPLAPEPFLIQGSIASRGHDYRRASSLLIAAVRRDPRSVAARFLLADLYLEKDLAGPALDQLSVLARLSPPFAQRLVPALARYAKGVGAAAELRRAMNANPELAEQLLAELASDPRNAALVLELARSLPSPGEMQPWQQKLLESLVQAGDYSSAYALWQRFDRGSLSVNPLAFWESKTPSPFSWTYASGSEASAEPVSGGLRVTFTGNQTAMLATKITRFEPGAYVVRTAIRGTAAGVSFKIGCLPANSLLLSQPLPQASGEMIARFTVPVACKAVRLDLVGEAQVNPAPADFSLSPLQASRASAQ